jgi:hypothetical protein
MAHGAPPDRRKRQLTFRCCGVIDSITSTSFLASKFCDRSQLSVVKASYTEYTYIGGLEYNHGIIHDIPRNMLQLCLKISTPNLPRTVGGLWGVGVWGIYGMPKRFKACWAAASLASDLRAALHDPISSPWTAMERRSA